MARGNADISGDAGIVVGADRADAKVRGLDISLRLADFGPLAQGDGDEGIK